MNYKYENFESVEVIESFKAHMYDEDYETTETIDIPVGVEGVIVSMGCNSTDNFENHYDIEIFVDCGREISVSVFEKNMEKYFLIIK